MCTAQFEGTTPLGDIFDWPALVQWLVEAMGGASGTIFSGSHLEQLEFQLEYSSFTGIQQVTRQDVGAFGTEKFKGTPARSCEFVSKP